MDSPRSDASTDKVEMGPSFRKLSSDTANRTYRRPTHVSQSDSSSSDDNNEHARSRNAISQKDSAKVGSNDQMRNDEEREVERRRLYSHADKYHDRYADKYSYRESRRQEDTDRRRRNVRHGEESGRDYARSSRSERSDNLDHKDRIKDKEKEHERYTSRRKDVDSGRDHYYRERDNKEYYDGRRGSQRSPERFDKNEKVKEKSRYRDTDEVEIENEKVKEKSRYRDTDEVEIEGVDRRKQYRRENENRKRSEPASSFGREDKQRDSKFSKPAGTNVEEKAGSSKQVTEASKDRHDPALPASTVESQAGGGTDLNAAKFAAMKAAEFVNKNIGGGAVGGPLTTEQKKKLLWGNKKNESTGAETVKNWNNLFTDSERQEKFNKLMGVKSNVVPENKPEEKEANQQGKSREELDMDLEKQYTAGLRRRDGRTVGLGL